MMSKLSTPKICLIRGDLARFFKSLYRIRRGDVSTIRQNWKKKLKMDFMKIITFKFVSVELCSGTIRLKVIFTRKNRRAKMINKSNYKVNLRVWENFRG